MLSSKSKPSLTFKLFTLASIGVSLFGMVAYSESEFNVYCTSNLDSTGVCVDESSKNSLDCIIIPGQIIECKDQSSKEYECVLIAQVTATQAQFSCSGLGAIDNTEDTEIHLDVLPNVLPNDFENAF